MHHLHQIVQRKGSQTFIVPALHLQTQLELQGLTAKVNGAHRIALNSLTHLITSDENECSLDPAKYGKAGDLPVRSRMITRLAVLQVLQHQGPDCLKPKQRQILETFLDSGPSADELETAAKRGTAPVHTNKRKSIDLPSASPFETRKELPQFEQLVEALLLRDRQAADQFAKGERILRPRCRSGRGNAGDSNLQKLVRQLPVCSTEAGCVSFLRQGCKPQWISNFGD